MRDKPTPLKPSSTWDFIFPIHRNCLQQVELLSVWDSLAQVALICSAVPLLKWDQAASFSILLIFFFLFTSYPVIHSFPAAMKDIIIWPELL